MKKLLCIMISAIMIVGIFSSLPLSSLAASQKVKLKKSSATLKIKKKNGKTVYGSTTIKIKKAKGVKINKVTYKSSSKKIAMVTSKGKVTAKKQGSAKISVKVKYKYKKKTYKKALTFNVIVKDLRTAAPTASTEAPTEPASTEVTQPTAPTQETEPATQSPTEGNNTVALNIVSNPTNTKYSFEDTEFLKKLSKFSNKLYTMTAQEENGNYTMSPVSVYMAVSMLYAIGNDDVKSDVKELTGMQDGDFASTGDLVRYLSRTRDYNGTTITQLNLTNSIWLNTGLQTDPNVLNSLASDYFCNAFETPFYADNQAANQAIRDFIKNNTNGLIDQNFNIPKSTLFTMINTLYFKDLWSTEYLNMTTEQRNFNYADGSSKTLEFLSSDYIDGQIQETDTSRYFYTTTSAGYKVKLILPKNGCTLKQAMSAENLNTINQDTEFNEIDSNNAYHYTCCIFPSFKVESSTPLAEVLTKNKQLENAFGGFTSPLVSSDIVLSDIVHRVVLDVNKKGVEGAAVTLFQYAGATPPDETVKIYHDFVLDKNFGFIITDKSDVVLFEGQITNP